jgi:hypothetical protein
LIFINFQIEELFENLQKIIKIDGVGAQFGSQYIISVLHFIEQKST